MQQTGVARSQRPSFMIFSPFSKDFLKYASDGKISENGIRAGRHPRWRQDNTAWRR
jgi:hypothetical protein